MGARNLLTLPVYLEAQPAMGAKPELRLKKGMSGVLVKLYILDLEGLTDVLGKRCIVVGVLPNGDRLFISDILTADWGKHFMNIRARNVEKMSAVPGTYDCTLTILDTEKAGITEFDYMDYETQTVLPFRVIVSDAAGREENA